MFKNKGPLICSKGLSPVLRDSRSETYDLGNAHVNPHYRLIKQDHILTLGLVSVGVFDLRCSAAKEREQHKQGFTWTSKAAKIMAQNLEN